MKSLVHITEAWKAASLIKVGSFQNLPPTPTSTCIPGTQKLRFRIQQKFLEPAQRDFRIRIQGNFQDPNPDSVEISGFKTGVSKIQIRTR